MTAAMGKTGALPPSMPARPAPIPWSQEQLVDYLFDGWEEEHGIAEGPMAPVVNHLYDQSEDDNLAIAAYLESLTGRPGDPARGERIVRDPDKATCLICHAIPIEGARPCASTSRPASCPRSARCRSTASAPRTWPRGSTRPARTGPLSGILFFSLTSTLTAAERAKLVLHVGSAPFALSDANEPTSFHTYQWLNSGLDWSSETSVTLRLRTANNAPEFTSSATLSIVENNHAVTVVAVDNDSDDDITGYEIVGGADEGFFSDVNNGVLSFDEDPNFEDPQDQGGNNTYEVTVEATSGTGTREMTATQTITVTVRTRTRNWTSRPSRRWRRSRARPRA